VRKAKELQSQKIQLKNMAIFYRSNYLSKSIEQALITENIEYKLFGSLRFYERQEIKDVLAYLKIIVMNDDIAFNRMINLPSRKIGDAAKQKILDLSLKKKKSIMNTVLEHFGELPLSPLAKSNLKTFLLLIKKYRIATRTNKPSVVVLSFLKEVGYVEM
jgi:DNA helicase-2/ATP-dependent DNA helicase PcrA